MTEIISANNKRHMMLCECGEFVEGHIFKDFIPTSSNPSTPTFGHSNCGLIFNFVDGKLPKRYSSRIELKCIAMKFAEGKKIDIDDTDRFLLEVDRLKSKGDMSDAEILFRAYHALRENNNSNHQHE
jgi:hypothetical protein